MLPDIFQFTGKNQWLSNFWFVPVTYEGLTYPSVEHEYQAAKSLDLNARLAFTNPLLTPGEAKRRGRSLTLRPDWEEVKLQVMHDLLRLKFTDAELRSKLLATDDAFLQEGNWWHDTFWGVDLRSGEGDNHLGALLMQVRKEIQREHATESGAV